MTAIVSSVNLLYPPFANQVNSALIAAKSEGFDIYIFESWRSPERQAKLHNVTATGPVWVTDAGAWKSWHQYGLAVDLAFGGPGKWSWNGPYDQVAKLMVGMGLRWIGEKDKGHFEYNHNISIAVAKQIALDSGILAVWYELEQAKLKEIN